MSVRIGFVGAGGINSKHMENLAKIEGAEHVAIADLLEERATERAEQYDMKAYTSWEEMLEEVPMDALYVAVPPFAHEGQEQAAAEKGIHLFVEKPVAIDIETAAEIKSVIDRTGVIATAGFQDRYQDIVERMKALLQDHEPGLIMGYWIGGMPGAPWWRVKSKSGGQAVEQTVHTFDMARNLLGEVETVHATYSTGLMEDVENYDVEDATCVNLQFESGLCGTIFSGCFLKGYGKVGLDIWCPEVKIEYAGRSMLRILEPGEEPDVYKVGNDFSLDIDKTFIRAVEEEDQSLLRSDYTDACRSLALPLAANESIETGGVVQPAKFED